MYKVKIYELRIDQSRDPYNDIVMIYIICSEHPFPLSIDQDVSDIFVYLDSVQENLSSLFSDTSGYIFLIVNKRILKESEMLIKI
jgi:hypothetical protein